MKLFIVIAIMFFILTAISRAKEAAEAAVRRNRDFDRDDRSNEPGADFSDNGDRGDDFSGSSRSPSNDQLDLKELTRRAAQQIIAARERREHKGHAGSAPITDLDEPDFDAVHEQRVAEPIVRNYDFTSESDNEIELMDVAPPVSRSRASQGPVATSIEEERVSRHTASRLKEPTHRPAAQHVVKPRPSRSSEKTTKVESSKKIKLGAMKPMNNSGKKIARARRPRKIKLGNLPETDLRSAIIARDILEPRWKDN